MKKTASTFVTLVLTLAAIAACGNSPPAKSGSVPKCPDSDNVPCMSAPTCVYDANRACESCRCETMFVPKEQLEPTTQGK
jgi:hypothetical protein